ncbi:erythrocyte binding protein [Bifidobacterium dolichotidis]|uniref:Erythrocyte binding protein n=1 Tax=Bifidobacterium dolichotidis TaxID=2306976 RepID=A0A430FPW3_9BIFI|nr:hypothetical protein [Bifidobacterium dolichotidis]RSX54870.1 erythrocyte binding protein [Bifidobacterium dolichotidis]
MHDNRPDNQQDVNDDVRDEARDKQDNEALEAQQAHSVNTHVSDMRTEESEQATQSADTHVSDMRTEEAKQVTQSADTHVSDMRTEEAKQATQSADTHVSDMRTEESEQATQSADTHVSDMDEEEAAVSADAVTATDVSTSANPSITDTHVSDMSTKKKASYDIESAVVLGSDDQETTQFNVGAIAQQSDEQPTTNYHFSFNADASNTADAMDLAINDEPGVGESTEDIPLNRFGRSGLGLDDESQSPAFSDVTEAEEETPIDPEHATSETQILDPADMRQLAAAHKRRNHQNQDVVAGKNLSRLLVAIAAFLAFVVVAFGVAGIVHANARHRLEEARQTCMSEYKKAKQQKQKFEDYLGKEAQEAEQISDQDVADPSTVKDLANEMKAQGPQLTHCNVPSMDLMQKHIETLQQQENWYDYHYKKLEQGVQRVKDSNEELRVGQVQEELSAAIQKARTTLVSSEGHVTDQYLWDHLNDLIIKADEAKNSHKLLELTKIKQDLENVEQSVIDSRNEQMRIEENAARYRALQEANRRAFNQQRTQQDQHHDKNTD